MSATPVATRKESASVPALLMDQSELMAVLQSSVYPGAKPESIKLVINQCRVSGKDPLKKPYHIVPMQVSTGRKDDNGWDIKEWRDVVMPGINDYRTDAARTGQHAGTSDPEFGPDVTEKLGDVTITYPQWCRIVVRRQLANGQVVEFAAREFWKENYATKNNKTPEPNAMWKKRPYAQLAKCAEAQALRKGFPEVGALPTADEMEGKEIDMGTIDRDTGEVKQAAGAAPQPYSDEDLAKNLPTWRNYIEGGRITAADMVAKIKSSYTLTPQQEQKILALGAIDGEFEDTTEGDQQ